MTIQNLNNIIQRHVEDNKINIEKEFIPNISQLCFKHNYIQIIYNYGIENLIMLMYLFESLEIYEECEKIKKTIENYKKLEKK